ncbi:MAG: Crp/Fnr family transcriptional regulator, partial [Coleofasciculus sp. S288]|nr:Crp/Fnr family transcriptional regulator [Coleofasciculus sp. S288]
MTASGFLPTRSIEFKQSKFPRRSLLPLRRDYLWRIETGLVRTLTWFEDGTAVTLGLWGAGDVVGQALSREEPYQIECLTPVEVTLLPLDRWPEVNRALIQHIQQFQEFLTILHCRSVDASLLRLLSWLA